MRKSRPAGLPRSVQAELKARQRGESGESSFKGTRETIESIAVAVVLAFLFRAFVAEAFVIPTGSMAPTLQGRHMDVTCEQCGCPYRTGASIENDKDDDYQVIATTCPICRYTMELKKDQDANQKSFNGDRILVSKFAYEFAEPDRWDVIVFKFPGNAKQNYIKRLVGLPNETIWVRHGDIYSASNADAEPADGDFRIARKEPFKLRAMLQMVHDTRYRAPELVRVGWPARWQDWSSPEAPAWRARPDDAGFETAAVPEGTAWLRYRHVVPRYEDWEDLVRGTVPHRLAEGRVTGQLIADYYPYNHGVERRGDVLVWNSSGFHWVGDLAVECDAVEVRGDRGSLLLDLVEGGVHYTCRIDVATGEAVLSIDEGRRRFVGRDGVEVQHPKATTKVHGPGTYDLRFSNCDDQLLLWVNASVVEFDGPTTYQPDEHVKPVWSPQDPGDLEPIGLGASGTAVSVANLRVLRDVYYVAAAGFNTDDEYDSRLLERDPLYLQKSAEAPPRVSGVAGETRERFIRHILADPASWQSTRLFDARRDDVRFTMAADQFFPLGDNSPQSRDARLWTQSGFSTNNPDPPPYVERELLTGKALLIYWPHAWRRPIPFFPNFRRMGLIR
jgi:signal peptidase I